MRRAIIGATRDGAAAPIPSLDGGSSKPWSSGAGITASFAGGVASTVFRMMDGAVRRNDAFRRSSGIAGNAGPAVGSFMMDGAVRRNDAFRRSSGIAGNAGPAVGSFMMGGSGGSTTAGGGCPARFRPLRTAPGRVRSSE
jgi:hypothetical protein